MTWSSVWLSAAVLVSACSLSAGVDDLPDAPSAERDAGAPDANALRGDACSAGNGESGTLYEPCVGSNDGSRGSCSAGEVCGSMPAVGYTYCMLAVPCPEGMVSVINLACAYPCDEATDCAEHGLARCAENSLAEFTDERFGWCTP